MASGGVGLTAALSQMCNMLGLGDMNADQLASKLEETLPVIRSVSEQFKDPVRPRAGLGGLAGIMGMPGRAWGCQGGEWGRREGDRDVAKPVCAHSCGESSVEGPARDPSRASVPGSWVCGGVCGTRCQRVSEHDVTLSTVSPCPRAWCHAELDVSVSAVAPR